VGAEVQLHALLTSALVIYTFKALAYELMVIWLWYVWQRKCPWLKKDPLNTWVSVMDEMHCQHLNYV